MSDSPDAELLEQFARNKSEPAFAELVRRHIGLVYSIAFRKTGNPQLSEDITQAVFIILARKAHSLSSKTVLPGWLHHTARLTVSNLQRAELRRVRREQEAFMQYKPEESSVDTLWRELSPHLDEAMAGLGATEREALVLRYFQNKSMAEVGQALGVETNTAQKRVGRALDKLRAFFMKRGVTCTGTAIAGVISTQSVQAVPATLVQSVTAVALTKGTAASTSTLTLIKGALKIMAWTKMKTAIVVTAGLLLAVGTTTVAIEKYQSKLENPVEYYVLHTPMTLTRDQLQNALVGNWKLVGAKSIKTGRFVVLDPHNQFFKTFTLTNWATTNYDSNSNVVNSAAGPYALDGEVSIETIETATGSKIQFLGAQVPYRIRVIGDDYYQMGMGPSPAIEQQWHRIHD